MKYLKVIVGLGLMPLGVFAGSFIRLGGGNGAIIGGILGGLRCCKKLRSSGPHWSSSNSLDEQYQVHKNVDKQALDNTTRSVQEAQLEDQIRYKGLDHSI